VHFGELRRSSDNLAAELTGTARREELLSSQSVLARSDNTAFGDEPNAHVAVANVKDLLTTFEPSGRAAREAGGELQLTRRQRRKELSFSVSKRHMQYSIMKFSIHDDSNCLHLNRL